MSVTFRTIAAAVERPTIGDVQGRQIAVVLIALIVIVGAGLIVLSVGGDDDDEATGATTTTSTPPETTTTTTTTLAPTTTSIPVDCTVEDGDETTEDGDETAEDGDEEDDDETVEDGDEPVLPTLGENSTLSTVGLDTVDFGMTVSQAEAASGHEMVPCEPVSECYRVVAAGAPPGISFLVHEGTIERIDIVDGPIETRSGIGIGTPAGRPLELWPDQIERQPLGADTEDLVFVPTDENDAAFRVVFTADGEEIVSMRAGRLPMVIAADPCAPDPTAST